MHQDLQRQWRTPKERRKEANRKRQKEKKEDAHEVFAIGLDVDSNSGLGFDWPPEKIPKQSAGTEEAVQSASAAMSAILLATGAQAPI